MEYKIVKNAEDMYYVKIGEGISHRGRKYVLYSYGGTVAKEYETFFVFSVKSGKRVEIKLPTPKQN